MFLGFVQSPLRGVPVDAFPGFPLLPSRGFPFDAFLLGSFPNSLFSLTLRIALAAFHGGPLDGFPFMSFAGFSGDACRPHTT